MLITCACGDLGVVQQRGAVINIGDSCQTNFARPLLQLALSEWCALFLLLELPCGATGSAAAADEELVSISMRLELRRFETQLVSLKSL